MSVKIKDRKRDIEVLRMALNMSELYISYEGADLIQRVIGALKMVNGDFSISDGIDIHSQWKREWEEYEAKNSK